jgi:hypothetical protein
MSICQICKNRRERPCTYSEQTAEYYAALIPALRHVAARYGYALAVHGSLKTDIDLVAAPWRDNAIRAPEFAEAIRRTAEIIIGFARIRDCDKDRSPEKKPCGRLAWSFYLTAYDSTPGPYIDLSVMPRGIEDYPRSKPDKKRRKARA